MMMCSFGKEQPFAPRWPNNPIRIESSPTRPKNIAIQRTNFDSPESTGVNPRDEPTVNRADITSISGTPVVVKHFRIKFFFSLAKQDLFPYFFGCLGILFEVKCVCCCIQKRPIYQSLQAVSRTSIDSICLP